MCTAAAYKTKDFYFGRTLDLDCSYGESVVVTPRSYPFRFRRMGELPSHYAMIGVAHVAENYPLYYEAVNEKGLCMAGLNFTGYAFYPEEAPGWDNVSPFELIPWILGQCASVREARSRLEKLRLARIPFSDRLPLAGLHWMISDRAGSIVVESVKEGLKVYDDPAGVLTNNPPFDEQMFHLNNFMSLSPYPPSNRFSEKLPLREYCRGMGALGLPGDLSSQSRFVRAAFVLLNSHSGDSESESVNQFFHILGAVEQPKGACRTEDGKCELTVYTCCANADRGIFYYTTYENHRITAVDMRRENLDGASLISYPLIQKEQICFQN